MIHNAQPIEEIDALYIQGAITEDEYKDAQIQAARNGQEAAIKLAEAKSKEALAYQQELKSYTDYQQNLIESHIKQKIDLELENHILQSKVRNLTVGAFFLLNLLIMISCYWFFHVGPPFGL